MPCAAAVGIEENDSESITVIDVQDDVHGGGGSDLITVT